MQRAIGPVTFLIEGIIPAVIAPFVNTDDQIQVAVIFIIHILPLTEANFLMLAFQFFPREQFNRLAEASRPEILKFYSPSQNPGFSIHIRHL